MPTYEYLCLKCAHRFDAFQGMNDEHFKRCPKCKGKVQRQIGTGAGIIFKGSGFYETDYKRSAPKTTEQKSAEGKKESPKESPKESTKESPKKKD